MPFPPWAARSLPSRIGREDERTNKSIRQKSQLNGIAPIAWLVEHGNTVAIKWLTCDPSVLSTVEACRPPVSSLLCEKITLASTREEILLTVKQKFTFPFVFEKKTSVEPKLLKRQPNGNSSDFSQPSDAGTHWGETIGCVNFGESFWHVYVGFIIRPSA